MIICAQITPFTGWASEFLDTVSPLEICALRRKNNRGNMGETRGVPAWKGGAKGGARLNFLVMVSLRLGNECQRMMKCAHADLGELGAEEHHDHHQESVGRATVFV